jgi:uncharacterized protein
LRSCWRSGRHWTRGRYWLAFECARCGECCSQLGYVHRIREEYGEYRFLVHNHYTGEDTPVGVAADKRALFDDKRIFEELPHACPFFRHQPGSTDACCTVHITRPGICRDYECWRLLVLDHAGWRAGRIRNSRTLVSDDPILTSLWERCADVHDEPDDRRWEDGMIRVLGKAGYSVRQ